MEWLTLPDHLPSDLVCAGCFGLLLVLIVAFGVKLCDFLWRRLDLEEQVQKGNVAAGIVMGSMIFGFCVSVGMVIRGILG
jgi:uncharacterized membrane protein YjfL (UPF0719 family)